MTYVHVVNGAIDKTSSRPTELTRLDNGATMLSSPYITDAELAACGWFPVTVPVKPTITAAQTFDPDTIALVGGTPTVVYHVRSKTAAELQADVVTANRAVVSDLAAVQTDITNLKAFLTDPDVQVVLDVANTVALTTQQLNRALKAMVRQQRRQANFSLRVARFAMGQYQPQLLVDISDISGN